MEHEEVSAARINILVLGSGAREHALAWKIAQSPRCEQVFLHPGNAGTMRAGFKKLEMDGENVDELIKSAEQKNIELVVIGPEVLLAKGYADRLREADLKVVGPNQYSAQLESSKVFAKRFMAQAGVATATYQMAASESELTSVLDLRREYPVVLKLDGLAAGKGVVIAQSREEATAFAKRIWLEKEFGPLPQRLIVEDCLKGRELSHIGLCDGRTFIPLASATDYKRIFDRGKGSNTGGMGAVSPSLAESAELMKVISKEVVEKCLLQFQKQKIDYRGVLYIGLMISPEGKPFVLEFNVRFGDPETQAILLRLESDFVEMLEHTAQATLTSCPKPRWTQDSSVYVVGAAEGYPEKPKVGDPISDLAADTGTQIFFAGVSEKNGELVTSGGRVLGVGALGNNIEQARKRAYSRLDKINWRAKQFRTDIGHLEPTG
ncbi:MAG: phosphoribosylamine--glycine ligase [Deltaproteobacteria bacterium]|nr:phosphoribosylamine--glycine ligase [Deltaproteobacteria bacterium]